MMSIRGFFLRSPLAQQPLPWHPPLPLRVGASLLAVWMVAGCSRDAASEAPPPDPLQSIQASDSSSDGVAHFEFQVGEDIRSFLITAKSSDAYLSIEKLVGPDEETAVEWEDWNNTNQSLTESFWPSRRDVVFNWPIRIADGPLEAGTWTIEVATTSTSGSYLSGKDVSATIQTMADDDDDAGKVNVRIVWADGLDNDEDLVQPVQQAVERWREIWASYGITLAETWGTSDLDPGLRYHQMYDRDIEDVAEEGTDNDLLLVIGDEVDGDDMLYGMAGGIPGSILPTPHSAVGISWMAHAGQNGRFDEDEISMMGETMAHEIGHFMGLFHPVEDGAGYFDALNDTPQCGSMSSCDNTLGDNLMYPYPLCSWTSCVAQEELTAQQQGVLQRYTGTY